MRVLVLHSDVSPDAPPDEQDTLITAQAVASARYLLICEWLDMKPIDTKLTSIDEAIILRWRRLPADFRDQATYAEPHRYPSGARTTVLVNGVVVVEDATHTGALPGQVLRRRADGIVG